MPDNDRVQQLVEAALDGSRTPEVVCADCPELLPAVAQRLRQVHGLNADLQNLFPAKIATTVSDNSQTKTLQPGLPTIPGYEVLGVLGRGGMGVVYQARQNKLNRLVALKMILAGSHAGPAELARFQTEGEAIARLQHPNIVQVHEVGEHEGKPFFSLEFCGGGSLDKRLNGTPLQAEEGAALVETLARAMQASHAKGIIHRDLKPANVLLTEDEMPKITDFGLAKKLDETGQTGTGAIMGTPSYMAPEQAAGKTKEIGPAADVYALGAILYECLTGRPPFKAATAIATIRQVVTDEPIPPSRLQTKTPRDLETICLKCLRKEPGERYSSALTLAQDLERFRAGEPILARPEGLARKLRRQLSKHRTGISALLVVLLAIAITGVVLWHTGAEQQEIALLKEFDNILLEPDWSPDHGKRLDQVLAQIDRLAPTQAADARPRLVQRFAGIVEEILNKRAKLLPQDIARVDSALVRLMELDVPRAEELRAAWKQKHLDWQTVIDLKTPFANLGEVFDDKSGVQEAEGKLQRMGKNPTPLLPTKVRCEGNLDFEAVFDETWESQAKVGLVLNCVPQRALKSLACAPDGQTIAVGLEDGTVELLDLASGKVLSVLHGEHVKAVTALAYTSNGKVLASGSMDGSVSLWELNKGQRQRTLREGPEGLRVFAISKDGTTLAAGGSASFVVWDLKGGKDTPFFTYGTGDVGGSLVAGLAFSPDGRTLYTAGGLFLKAFDVIAKEKKYGDGFAWRPLASLTLSPDGSTVAMTMKDLGGIFFRDAATGENRIRHRNENGAGVAFCLAYSQDGTMLACGYSSGMVVLVDPQSGKVKATLEGMQTPVSAVVFSPDGQSVVGICGGNSLLVWDRTSYRTRALRERGDYQFLVRCPSGAGKPCSAEVYRHGKMLQTVEMQIPPGSLQLRAHREGDLLTFQINELPPLVLRDLRPFRPREGFFWLYWSAGGLVSLTGKTQVVPPGTTPIERGNELFDRGQFQEALLLFQEHERVSARTQSQGEARRQAACLTAFCLVKLNRLDEAVQKLEGVFGQGGGPNEVWPLLAGLELWLLHLRQNQQGLALSVLDDLLRRYPHFPGSQMARSLITEEVIQGFWSNQDLRLADWMLLSPSMIRRLICYNEVFRLKKWQSNINGPEAREIKLVWAYRLDGQKERACQAAQDLLPHLPFIGPLNEIKEDFFSRTRFWNDCLTLEECCWLARCYGQPGLVEKAIVAKVFEPPDLSKLNGNNLGQMWLLVERCRFQAARQDWDGTNKTLDLIFSLCSYPDEFRFQDSYEVYALASLMRGLLRERRGDKEGALEAWKHGLRETWVSAMPEAKREKYKKDQARYENEHDPDYVFTFLLPALTGQLTPKLTREMGIASLYSLDADSPHKPVVELLSPGLESVHRQMWRSPQGRQFIWQMVFREIPEMECRRAPLLVEGAELIRQQALTGVLSNEQEDLIQKLVDDVLRAYGAGRINTYQALNLIKAWDGKVGDRGWAGVSPHLDSGLRGPVAYVLGQRYLRLLNMPQEAEMLFRIAREDASSGAPLHRLASEALDRLKVK